MLPGTPAPSPLGLPRALWFAFLAAAATALAFFSTTASIVETWARSETFTHGFFVLPIFLWLVWRERERLAALPPSPPDTRPLPLIAAAGLLWLLSRTAGILVGEQIALVSMIILIMHVFAGRETARAIRFPLFFLLFLAPVGEELVPVLMEVTADLTVGAVALTGIPIYREGLYFSLPTGDWSVVEACSGIRYLIASITLGSLYAYLNYESPTRRLAFICLSAVVPILANGVRAFLIVMIGHFSGMQLATGVDHLVYGWLFFGVVMFALFSIGALFSEPRQASRRPGETTRTGPITDASRNPPVEGASRSHGTAGAAYLRHVCLAALCIGIWPLWSVAMDATAATDTSPRDALAALPFPPDASAVPLERKEPGDASRPHPPEEIPSDETLPPGVPDRDEAAIDWRPSIGGHDAARSSVIADATGGGTRTLALAYLYLEQRQGKEMISSANVLVPTRGSNWRRTGRTEASFRPPGSTAPITVERTRLDSSGQDLIVWRWYRVGETHTGETWRVKLLELRERLLLRRTPSVAYVLAVDASNEEADTALADAAARIVAASGPTASRPAAL